MMRDFSVPCSFSRMMFGIFPSSEIFLGMLYINRTRDRCSGGSTRKNERVFRQYLSDNGFNLIYHWLCAFDWTYPLFPDLEFPMKWDIFGFCLVSETFSEHVYHNRTTDNSIEKVRRWYGQFQCFCGCKRFSSNIRTLFQQDRIIYRSELPVFSSSIWVVFRRMMNTAVWQKRADYGNPAKQS